MAPLGVKGYYSLMLCCCCWQTELVQLYCRWMDGTFSDLNPDAMANEVDDYSKEVHKLMRLFATRFKKQMAKRDDREHERRKSYRRKSRSHSIEDPTVAALQQPEAEVEPPPAIHICERVIAQLNEFKVHFTLMVVFIRLFNQLTALVDVVL